METGKPTPRALFSLPVRYVVPLFQRGYVWNQQYHWEPLWDDIRDTAARSFKTIGPRPHFLGAIVLKQLTAPPGEPTRYLVVDGQQRLITLQLAMAGIRDALTDSDGSTFGKNRNALRMLTENPNLLEGQDNDRYKIVPFYDEDIQTFSAIIDGRPSPRADHPMAQCHMYFRDVVAEHVAQANSEEFVSALIRAVCDSLQIVSLNLDENENEHLIFETLNARAEPLTEWEKARNLFFAEISERYDKKAEQSFYNNYIRRFDEQEWWTEEIWAQRRLNKRVGVFLRNWLEVRHTHAVPPHRVYYWFRRLARGEKDIRAVADSFVHYAGVYREIQKPPADHGRVERQFLQRRAVLAVGVVVPLLMRLYDRLEAGKVRDKCIQAIESWLVRRMLAGYNARGYDKLFMKLLQRIDDVEDPCDIAGVLISGLQEGWTWPTDQQVQSVVVSRPMYPWHAQRRVRMVLEGIESFLIAESGAAGYDTPPKEVWIEHVMPQAWREHWPFSGEGTLGEEERDRALVTLGNLTLTTSKLNIKLSHRPWREKRELLKEHDNLFLTKHLLKDYGEPEWNEDSISRRGFKLAEYICKIWPRATDS